MPILTPLEGELLIAGITIGHGLFVEKWYVGKDSITFNVFTWLVLLFTIEIPSWLLGLMALWLFIGYFLTREDGHGSLKQLFGSKVFGSLALVLGLIQYFQLEIGGVSLLIVWAVVVIIIVWLGRKIRGTRRR